MSRFSSADTSRAELDQEQNNYSRNFDPSVHDPECEGQDYPEEEEECSAHGESDEDDKDSNNEVGKYEESEYKNEISDEKGERTDHKENIKEEINYAAAGDDEDDIEHDFTVDYSEDSTKLPWNQPGAKRQWYNKENGY